MNQVESQQSMNFREEPAFPLKEKKRLQARAEQLSSAPRLACVQLLISMWSEEVLLLFKLSCCSGVLLMAKLKERASVTDIIYINISIYNIDTQYSYNYNAAVLKLPHSETL